MISLHNDTITLDLDVRAYLADRLPARFLEDARGRLIGACLFHADGARPNLGVDAETGGYRCLSCGASGNFVSLVQRIEGFARYGDALSWLIENYGADGESERPVRLSIGVDLRPPAVPKRWSPPDPAILAQYNAIHPYMSEQRGISEEWQRAFSIGFDRRRSAVTFPWFDRHEALMTVKFRPTWTKTFWYTPVPPGVKKSLLYGLHLVQQRGERRVAVVEAEIDAISVWQGLNLAAVAVGGSTMSDEQARELALAGVEEVVPLGDRDEAGERLNAEVQRKMAKWCVRALDAEWPRECDAKDANDILRMGRLGDLRVIESKGLSLGRGRSA